MDRVVAGWSRSALAALLAALVVAFAACGGEQASSPGSAADRPSAHESADLIHVHGLGVNPSDGALFIATHTGLFRLPPGSERPQRVGDSRQDTMGFTVVGPDRFLGSGHPAPGQNAPPLLGLIRSQDAGRTWTTVSLAGEADFHILRAAGDGTIYGLDSSNGRLMRSTDGGETWSELPPPGALIDLAPEPGDPARVVASTDSGLSSSRDGGETWRELGAAPPGLLAWPSADALIHVAADGRVSVSADGGRSWRGRGSIGGRPAAFSAADARRLHAARADGTIVASRDGGATWQVAFRGH